MNERERLIELICDGTLKTEICTTETHLDCDACRGDCGYCTILADHLLANGVTVQRWIPVTERLPETTRLCIASKYNVPFLAWWTGKDWRAADTVTVVDGINYWKELPQPPEENDYEKDL